MTTGQKRSKAKVGHSGASKLPPANFRVAAQRNSSPELKQNPGLVVGIGASAGGLAAFQAFLTNMPSDSGVAFVLVQHLSPDHTSILADLLGKATAMPVAEAEDGMMVAANHVYVIPPDATLTIKDLRLGVMKPAPPRVNRRPIDTFFSSLAGDQGENAVCIVLSGTGSDGTLGLIAIKEHGGLTLAQAEFDHSAMSGMPRSAEATGLVDEVIPVESMPERLIRYLQHLSDVASHKGKDGTRGDMAAHLVTIGALLRARIGHDFSQYKEKTLVRRIQRRMQVLQIGTAHDYVARLKAEPGELDALFREFLIGVTQFFRDPSAFEALQTEIIPKLLEGKRADDTVRIWIPGCATGEEVYSIAILVKEAMDRRAPSLKVQIFGTDIDDRAVATARAGRYRKPLIGVSPERFERWFAMEGDRCCPIKAIRDMCVFSTHSLVKDPPFSKLDLISCRNLLIYLDTDLQDRVVRTFHYALRPGGTLFLGPSESLAHNAKFFTTLDKTHRIFRRHDGEIVPPEFPPAATAIRVEAHLAGPRAPSGGEDQIDRSARGALEKYSPVYVVIDKHHEILRFSGGESGHYLEPSPGAASLNLFSILRKPLRPIVRTALQTMSTSQEPVVHSDIALKIEGKNRLVKVVVAPLAGDGARTGLGVVAFLDTGAIAGRHNGKPLDKKGDANVRALEQELGSTKAQLQAAIGQFDIVNEEMKSSNEEYQSVNEELQSSNEELETAKEEMQSVNEELQTVNAELSRKNELLLHLNSDLKNLFDSTEIATIFLDNDLRVKSFTPGMTGIFHLRDSDRGRPITEIVTLLSYSELARDAQQVMRHLSIVEHEVQIAENGAVYIMRIRPYRTVENVVDGVVITFVDISDRKLAEAALRENRARLQFALDSAQVGDWDLDLTTNTSRRSLRHDNAFGYQEPVQDWGFDKFILHVHPEDRADIERQFHVAVTQQTEWHFDCRIVWPDGSLHWIAGHGSIYRATGGKATHMLGIVTDITERKLIERQAALLMGELDHRVKNILAIVASVISQTLKATPSPEAFAASMEGRIAAISRAHGLLTQRGGKDEASLRDLIATELIPFNRGGNVVVDGVDVALTPKSGLSLAMAIHELASNAAKYGALSAPAGRLRITCEIAGHGDARILNIARTETGGPAVRPPLRSGFGTAMIERTLSYEFGAAVKLDFDPSGLRCTIAIPLTDEVGHLRRAGTGTGDA